MTWQQNFYNIENLDPEREVNVEVGVAEDNFEVLDAALKKPEKNPDRFGRSFLENEQKENDVLADVVQIGLILFK